MALDDKSVEAHVHGLLSEGSYELALAADVGWIADNGERRVAQTQLDGYVPPGHIAVEMLAVGREAAMDCTKAVDACVVDALERSYPELKVGG